MNDSYDEMIDYLKDNPNDIYRLWSYGVGLFQFASRPNSPHQKSTVGCLTMIKGNSYVAPTFEITEKIRADERVPADSWLITPDSLEVFAEYQRLFDELWGAKPDRHFHLEDWV